MSKSATFKSCLILFVLAGSSITYSLPMNSPKPLRKTEVLALVAGQSMPENIVHAIKSRGLAFTPTDDYRAQLKKAGANESVLLALDAAKPASPGAPNDPTEQELLQRLITASAQMHDKKYDEAAQELSEALKNSLEVPEAGFVMGEILGEREDWVSAAAVYSEVLREDPNFPDTHNKLSFALYQLDDSDSALREAKLELAENPDNPQAHNDAGLAFMLAGKLDASIAEYREAIRLKPDYAGAHNNLGVVARQRHDVDTAIEEYKKAVLLNPAGASYHYNLGTILGENGHIEEAVRELREAKRLDPSRLDVRQNLAANLMKRDVRGAIAELRELEKIAPNFEICHVCLGNALVSIGDTDAAVDQYHKAAELDPSDFNIPLALGRILEFQKKYDQALSEYGLAEQLGNSQGSTHLAVGRVLLWQKHYMEAIPELKQAVMLSPADAESHTLLGRALSEFGSADDAIAECKEAVSIDPKRSDAMALWAELLEKKGDWVGAMQHYKQAVQIQAAVMREDHHGQPFLSNDEVESKYRSAQLRFDEHVKALTAAGKTKEAADLQERLRTADASAGVFAQLERVMMEGDQARKERRFVEAERSYKQAVELAEKSPTTSEMLITALEDLGGVYGFLQNFSLADAVLHRALAVVEQTYGAASVRSIRPLQYLARNAMAEKDFTSAENYALRALKMSEKDIGEDNPNVYESLQLISVMYSVQQFYEKARPYQIRAVTVGERLYGTQDYRSMAPLYHLCETEIHLQHFDAASDCYAKLIPEMETIYGAGSPDINPVLMAYADALKHLGRNAEAGKVEQRLQAGPQKQ